MLMRMEQLKNNLIVLKEKLDIMKNKLARIKYLPNNFEIIEEGDHVICAVSGKKIFLDNLNYWNVELQEPYFSYIEASQKREKLTKES